MRVAPRDHVGPRDRSRRRALAAMLALAAAPAVDARAGRAPRFERGRLFRLSRRGTSDSFVFGTIHLADPRVSDIPSFAYDALLRTRTLALELAPVPVRDVELDALELLDDGRMLEPLIGSDAYDALRVQLFATGTPQSVLARLKPWAAMLRLDVRTLPDDARSLEENLLAQARGRKMSWISLESVEEQAAAFDTIPIESQVALLRHALAHRDALAADAESSIEAWQRGDLAALAALPEATLARFPAMRPHYMQLARHIVVDRTALLHHRLFLPLRSGNVFAAVGASHLPGPEGLLAMVAADGHRITRIE